MDLPSVETAVGSPFAATSSAAQPRAIQRRPAATNSAAATSAAPTPIAARAVTTDSVAAARIQRTVETSTPSPTSSEGENKTDRASLPSITSQLRQMRPAMMPKPKEAAPAEPISYNLPPTVQRASEPGYSTSPAAPAPVPTIRPAPPSIQAEGTPRLRRMPRAQITEVTSRMTESAVFPNTPSVSEIAQDIAPEATRPTPISSAPLSPSTVARSTDGPASAMPQAVTPPPDAVRPAPQIELQDTPPVSASPMSPRQLARLFSAARPSVQRQVEATSQTETPSQVQSSVAPPVTVSQATASRTTVSPEETRVRRFVETVQREARAFTGQVGEQRAEIRNQESGIGDQAEVVQRVPEPTPATNQPKAVPPAQVGPQIQRAISQTSETEPATSVADQAVSPAIQRTREQTSVPSIIEAASPPATRIDASASQLQRAPAEVSDRVEPSDEPNQPGVPQVRPQSATPHVQRQTVQADNAIPLSEETDQFASDVTSASVAPVQTTASTRSDGPVVQRSVESAAAVRAAADLPLNQSAQLDAPPELSGVAEAAVSQQMPRVPGEVSDGTQDSSGVTPARIQRQPEVPAHPAPPLDSASAQRVPQVQAEVGPIATVQRAVAPEADRGVAAPRGESVTALLRQRIADQAVQRSEAETEPSAPQAAESATPLEAASPIQPATARTAGEARLQRMPDLPLIRRAQADQSDAEKPSAPPPERKPPSATAPVERIQRTIEPGAVSSAPANRVQRVLGEASGGGASIDLDQLAREVYPIVKRLIAIERERRG